TANLFGTDPVLAPLADNGGPTQTHALPAGSPALHQGSNPAPLATDQRGPPPQFGGRGDIGALEDTPRISLPARPLAALLAAVGANETTTIDLAAQATYTLTQVDDFWYGPDGLPPVDKALTINGNGAVLVRAAAAPAFRFFYVSGGFDGLPAGSLTLNNL